MAVLIAKPDGTLAPTTKQLQIGKPVEVGKPLGLSMLTFFPGRIKKDWGGKAEMMITSEIRVGPVNKPAPKRVNMLLQKYPFQTAPPIADYGGDVYGDPMLYYSKAYAGQRLGVTMRGVETDKFSAATWKGMTKAIEQFGDLALFTSAAPYLAYLSVAVKIAKVLQKAISRNDRLQTSRVDLYFDEQNKKLLQSGRYLLWEPDAHSHWKTLSSKYKLTSEGADEPNVLVAQDGGEAFKSTPYFVLQIDPKKRKEYDDFEIGAGSAELLETWGDVKLGPTVLNAIGELAKQVNDAKQLGEIEDLLREHKKAKTDEEKAAVKAKIDAHAELFTENNAELLTKLLEKYLKA